MGETKRFWFKCSETYMKGPWSFAGVLATSWEEATERLIEANIPEFMIPGTRYLSCNYMRMLEREDHPSFKKAPIVTQRPLKPRAQKVDRATHERRMNRIIAGLSTE